MNSVNALTNIDYQTVFYHSLPLKYKIIWLIGRETGLRVSDILSLKIKDIISMRFAVTEKKTGKSRECDLTSMSPDERFLFSLYLLQSHGRGQEYAFCGKDVTRPLSRYQVHRVFSAVAKRNALEGIGTHTMRKTFAREHFKRNGDLSTLQDVLNHKHSTTTLSYLFDKSSLATLKGFF